LSDKALPVKFHFTQTSLLTQLGDGKISNWIKDFGLSNPILQASSTQDYVVTFQNRNCITSKKRNSSMLSFLNQLQALAIESWN
jgi:hypothetical protein